MSRERSDDLSERNLLLAASVALDRRAVRANDHDRVRAAPAGLRHLPLERAPGVVGVGRDARRGAARRAGLQDAVARSRGLVDDEEHLDAGCRR